MQLCTAHRGNNIPASGLQGEAKLERPLRNTRITFVEELSS